MWRAVSGVGILEHTAKVQVLATSREPLGIPGEHRVGVEPLGEGEGARLFADRARAVRPGLVVSSAEVAAAVARICEEVAGLPLGIELAAARAAARTPAEIADDLAGRVDRLAGARPGPVRHRSVAAVVDWSLDRLSESEQDLAEHLGVFSGGCTAESAAAVCRRDVADTTDLLVALVERSVVTQRPMRGHTRYVLVEPVRARWKAPAAARTAALLRLVAYAGEVSEWAEVACRAPAASGHPALAAVLALAALDA